MTNQEINAAMLRHFMRRQNVSDELSTFLGDLLGQVTDNTFVHGWIERFLEKLPFDAMAFGGTKLPQWLLSHANVGRFLYSGEQQGILRDARVLCQSPQSDETAWADLHRRARAEADAEELRSFEVLPDASRAARHNSASEALHLIALVGNPEQNYKQIFSRYCGAQRLSWEVGARIWLDNIRALI